MPYAARGICAPAERRLVGIASGRGAVRERHAAGGAARRNQGRLRRIDGSPPRSLMSRWERPRARPCTQSLVSESRRRHRRIAVGVGSGSKTPENCVQARLMPRITVRPTWATRLPSQGLDEGGSVLQAAAQGGTDGHGHSIRSPPPARGDPSDSVRCVEQRPPGLMIGELPCVSSRCVGVPAVS
jgi:hypothetical protein